VSEVIVCGSMVEVAHFIQLVNNARDKPVFMLEASLVSRDKNACSYGDTSQVLHKGWVELMGRYEIP